MWGQESYGYYDYYGGYTDYPVGYDGGYGGSYGGEPYDGGYGYGHGGYSYVSWFPIAFTPTSEFPAEYAEGMPTGTASFDGTTLTWASTFAYSVYTYAYIDMSCMLYDYGVPYDTVSTDEALDTGDWGDWGDDDGWDAPFDTHASGFTAPDSLPCELETWGYYDGYYGEDEVDVGVGGDWGEEEPPSSIPPMDEERYSSDLVDIWTLELSGGDSVFVSIDVLDSANTSSPSFIVISPESCPIAYAGGDISCTEDMYEWPGCPASEFVAEEDGTHYVMVSASVCSTEEAPYLIGVDAGTDPDLTLLVDNTTPFSLDTIEYAVTGSATVSE